MIPIAILFIGAYVIVKREAKHGLALKQGLVMALVTLVVAGLAVAAGY